MKKGEVARVPLAGGLGQTEESMGGIVPNIGQIYYELERARDNLNQRYLNNNDQSAGRSARAIMSALCAFDSIRAALSKES